MGVVLGIIFLALFKTNYLHLDTNIYFVFPKTINVLAINLGKGKDTNQGIKSALDEIMPENRIPFTNRSHQCYEYSDFILEPELSQFSTSSFRNLEEIYKIGYDTAKEKMQEIVKAIKERI